MSTAQIFKFPSSASYNDVKEVEKINTNSNNGFMKTPHSIHKSLAKLDVTGRMHRVLYVIQDLTFSFHKDTAWVSPKLIATEMGYESDNGNLRKDITALVKRNVLVKNGIKVGFNLTVSEWVLSKGKEPSKAKCNESTDKKVGRNQPINRSKSTHKQVEINPLVGRNQPPYKENNKESIKENNKDNVRKVRVKKSDSFKKFFAMYPAIRKGGTDATAWEKWKTKKLTDQDADLAIAWLTQAAEVEPNKWGTAGGNDYCFGITKFIGEKYWLTPCPAELAPFNDIYQAYNNSIANQQYQSPCEGKGSPERKRIVVEFWNFINKDQDAIKNYFSYFWANYKDVYSFSDSNWTPDFNFICQPKTVEKMREYIKR